MRSIISALNSGVDFVEEDLLITADGVLVFSHDDLVQTADGSAFRISQTSYKELSGLELRAHHGAPGETFRLLSLEEILPILKDSGMKMNLDLKSDACVEPVSSFIIENELIQQIILSGCETERAIMVNHVNKELRKLLNVDSSLFASTSYSEAVRISCEDAKRANCFGMNVNFRLVDAGFLQMASRHGLDVYVWTVDEESQMKRFIEWGVQSITTRNISALLNLRM